MITRNPDLSSQHTSLITPTKTAFNDYLDTFKSCEQTVNGLRSGMNNYNANPSIVGIDSTIENSSVAIANQQMDSGISDSRNQTSSTF